MNEHLRELMEDLPAYLGGHMLLTAAALAVGLLLSLPLGVFVSRRPRLSEWALGAAGVLQTIPSLALLALMVPLLGGMIGFLPAFLAMTLYSFLPILANTVIGIRGVDASLLEAGRGLGMSERQLLLRVQLPLAAPVIIGGVRTATVLVVGAAALATPVGETTLGNYIFAGLNTRDNVATVFGCICCAALAVLLDQLVHLLEVASRRRSARLFWTATAALLLLVGGGLYKPVSLLIQPPSNPAVVGSADYTEQHILAEVLKETLHDAGFSVDQRKGMGESIEFASLCAGHIDCYVDYTGNIWTTLMKRTEPRDPATTLREVSAYLREQHGVTCLGPLGFENAYALAMRRADATRLQVRTIGDLARHSGRMRIAGDLQFFHRPEWQRVKSTYGLSFAETRPVDPTLMYPAIQHGSVEVICAYTSDGRVPAFDLVVLDDPLQAFPPYEAVLLLSPRAARREAFREALLPILGRIDLTLMQQANGRVDIDGRRPRQAGAELLERMRRRKRVTQRPVARGKGDAL